MDTSRTQADDTRSRLIESASAAFAESGFRGTTIADICERAGANVASVNYYFGSKEKLYDEVLAHTARVADELFPRDGGLPENAPAEERLRAFVTALLLRSMSDGPGGRFHAMVALEFANPGSTVIHKMKAELRTERLLLQSIVADLVGECMSRDRLRRCCHHVRSLCVYYGFNRIDRERFLNRTGGSRRAVERLAERITVFALAGIEALARMDETEATDSQSR